MSVQYIIYLTVSSLMTYLLVIGCLDCRHICYPSTVSVINELLQKGCFFLKTHVTVVSTVMVSCYSFKAIRKVFLVELI